MDQLNMERFLDTIILDDLCPVCGKPLINETSCMSCGTYLNQRLLKLYQEKTGKKACKGVP